MVFPRELNTNTPLSKFLSVLAFLIIPFIAFFSGVDYQSFVNRIELSDVSTSYSQYYAIPTDAPTFVKPSITLPSQSTSPDEGVTKTFTSPRLKISFIYDDHTLGGDTNVFNHVKEDADKVYVYAANVAQNYNYKDGQYLEEFQKDPHQTLAEAIQTQFLKGVASGDCYVDSRNMHQSNYPASYETAGIQFNKNSSTADNPWAGAERCPSPYTITNGDAYFIMDKNHPDTFLFLSIGQYAILSKQKMLPNGTLDGTPWQYSITFL